MFFLGNFSDSPTNFFLFDEKNFLNQKTCLNFINQMHYCQMKTSKFLNIGDVSYFTDEE